MIDERELVERCRAGDDAAFGQLIEAYHERVYRAAYAVTADPAEAGDAAQETWVKAWRGLRGFRGDAALGTWLTRLALNAATDRLRRRRVRDLLGKALPFRPRGPATGDVEDRDELRWALDQLAPDARRLVGLRYGCGLSLAEVAALCGCPEGTVKSRLHAAVGRLRALVRDEQAGGADFHQAKEAAHD